MYASGGVDTSLAVTDAGLAPNTLSSVVSIDGVYRYTTRTNKKVFSTPFLQGTRPSTSLRLPSKHPTPPVRRLLLLETAMVSCMTLEVIVSLTMLLAGVRYFVPGSNTSTLLYNTWPVNTLTINSNSLYATKYYIAAGGDAQ